MFGKKKEITQKFIVKNEDETEDSNSFEIKGEKNKNSVQDNADNNFIFYGSDNKFTKQLEIYATLKDYANEKPNSKNKKLVLIVVDSTSPIEYLSYKICESFGQFPEYQNLEGLTATNLTKMDEEKKILPTEGKVGDILRNGDIIYLDLISNEIWIKINFFMSNISDKSEKLNISMDVKIKNELTFRELRYKLLKCGIICYLNKFTKSEYNFHYIISKFSLIHSVHGYIDENKLKTFENMRIKQLFKFKDSMKLEIKFYPLEFVLFQKLKAISIPKKEKTKKKKFLWDKFKSLRFEKLLNYNYYYIEKEYIFKYIKKIFESKTLQSRCYIYYIDNDNNLDVADDALDDNKKEDEKDLSILNINYSSESNEYIEMEKDLKRHKSVSHLNNSFLNRSRTKTINGSMLNNISLIEENKYSLIVVPSNDDQFRNKKLSSKNLLENLEVDADNIIKEESEDENEIFVHKNRKNSFKKKSSKKITYGALNFDFFNKEDLLEEEDDELIIYKDLKPKEIMKKPRGKSRMNIYEKNNKIDLCDDFNKYFDKNKFIDFISGLFLMYIKKGYLEKCTIPNFRGFKIEQKDTLTLNNKKKKKKRVKKSGSFYYQIFPIKRINFEIGIFSIFIISIFIFLSYLISNTYY